MPLAILATILFCLLCALFPTLVAYSYFRLKATVMVVAIAPLWKALLFAALYTLSDWMRSWVFSGFPWLALGYAHAPASPLAGFAPLFGVFGLSFSAALVAALLYCRWQGALLALALLLSGLLLRPVAWSEADKEPIHVAIIQGNVALPIKFDPDHLGATMATYRNLISAYPAQLTVLPETSFPVNLSALPAEYLQSIRRLALREGGDLLFGTITGDHRSYFNSAASIGANKEQVYNKRHLVPFGEFPPSGFKWVMQWLHIPLSDFSAGADKQPSMRLAGLKVAVNICFEDVFGDELIEGAREANLLVNMSNTAWFGNSLAQGQHLQIARMRALETGRPFLRATNTGMTAIINPRGELQASLPAFTRGVLHDQVQGYSGLTPFLRWGSWPVVALCLLIAGAALTIHVIRERRARP